VWNGSRLTLALAASTLAIALGALATVARGSEELDPTVPGKWVVGAPRGARPMDRVDAARTGRARDPLPSKPRILWRARIQGGVAQPVAVDARGAVIVSSPISTVTELSPAGKTAWSSKTGATPPATSPVLTSDGTRVVLTTAGELYGFDRAGRERFSVALPLVATGRVAEPLPERDGGLVVAAGRTVIRVDRSGLLRASARLDADVTTIVARGSETLIVTERGDVFGWKPPAEPTEVASFGARVDGAALDGQRLTAVVDQKRLVDLDLGTGTRFTRAENALGLAGPPALAPAGSTRVVTLDGLLLAHDTKGDETLRVALEPPSMIGDAGATVLSASSASPPVIVDAKGSVGFVRPGLDAGVVDAAGNVRAAPGAACIDPIGIAPAGSGRMVLACRSGVVFLLGDK
jgi:hypothetical protein